MQTKVNNNYIASNYTFHLDIVVDFFALYLIGFHKFSLTCISNSVGQQSRCTYLSTIIFIQSLFCVTELGFEFRALHWQSKYSSAWATLRFYFGYSEDGVLQTTCPGWPRNKIFQISASQVAKIIGMSHWCLAWTSNFQEILHDCHYEGYVSPAPENSFFFFFFYYGFSIFLDPVDSKYHMLHSPL
jgi:hypothetical protein